MSPAVEPGSSPLTRGKHPHHARNDQRTGLIPAHAGKTSSPGVPCCASWAHPHSRGENIITGIIGVLSEGSSPLTRGKLSCCLPVLPVHGLIPAHAGKTSPTCNATPTTWDHPRSRGENRSCCSRGRAMSGSSPLTRGKRSGRAAKRLVQGIIPAHAGKTFWAGREAARPGDHPRSRGENAKLEKAAAPAPGSSPLTRGKHTQPKGTKHGIIPAHAGKTLSRLSMLLRARDHPRSRGENSVGVEVGVEHEGSSPLTRGKPTQMVSALKTGGIIPAHAGKTRTVRLAGSRRRDHPRSRGENCAHFVGDGDGGGSSPLTRGKHRPGHYVRGRLGIIPAHAGKTSPSATS